MKRNIAALGTLLTIFWVLPAASSVFSTSGISSRFGYYFFADILPLNRLSSLWNEPEIRAMMLAFIFVCLVTLISFSRKVGRPVPTPAPPPREISEFIQSVSALNPRKPLELDNHFSDLTSKRWGINESGKLLLILQKLQRNIQLDEQNLLVENVQAIRQFSIRNKLDHYV